MPLSQCRGDGTINSETKCQELCVHPTDARNLVANPPQMALPSQLNLYDQALKDQVFLALSFPLFPPLVFPIREGNGSLNGRIGPWLCILFLPLTSV